MTRTRRILLLTGFLSVVAATLLGVGYAIGAGPDDGRAAGLRSTQSDPAVEGLRLPTIQLQRLDGTTVNTRELLGTPLIINNWYSTCAPCQKELPALAEVHREAGKRVRFVGVDLLAPSPAEEAFARGRGVDYELLYDPDGTLTSALAIATAPTTLFVAADGTIVAATGELTAATLRAHIGDAFP
jgi:thiol-disulfide isomerase/thioredoxin